MPRAKNGAVEIEYEVHGDPKNPTLLLVAGLAGQLTLWADDFVQALVDGGFQVVTYDNRDVGKSSDFGHLGPFDTPRALKQIAAGEKPDLPYTLYDMAQDGVAVLDALGVRKAHVCGMSMGGMIAQIIAAKHSDRTLSLTSVMSSSSRPGLPPGKPEAMKALLNRPVSEDREVLVKHGMELRRVIGSPGYPFDDATLRAFVERNVDRRYYPEGVGRQYGAIVGSGDRVELLKGVRVPSLVIHGADDPVVNVAGGRDVAALIPGCQLEIYPGMGHDFAPGLIATLAERIVRHCKAA
jgi:pimeloyl-ACP methyl ester carboxylesterase